MPVALIIEIVEAIASFAPQIPEIASLVGSAKDALTTGTVTPEQEAAIRAQLDAVKAQIDAG